MCTGRARCSIKRQLKPRDRHTGCDPLIATVVCARQEMGPDGKWDCTGNSSKAFKNCPEAGSVTRSSAPIRSRGCATHEGNHRTSHGNTGADGWPAAGAGYDRLLAAPPLLVAALPES